MTCHSYNDQGGSVGPALDSVAGRLGYGLELALFNPSATILTGYEVKVVEQQDGTSVRGRYRNDAELAVQIQSEDGTRRVNSLQDRIK